MTDLSPPWAWLERACEGVSLEIFFEAAHEENARAICLLCREKFHCLDWALKKNEVGVWGGTTDAERRKMLRGGHRAKCPGCRDTAIYSDGQAEICTKCGFSWLI